MIQSKHEDVSSWASRIDTVIGNIPCPIVQRVVVVESVRSTQDTALEFARGRSDMLLVASQQTNGRGTHGREWDDGDRSTLPCTFVLKPTNIDAPTLSSLVACALHETLNALVTRDVDLRIKWPNDIIARTEAGDRKLSGVLIEQRMGLCLIGIGVNCVQSGADWSPGLRDVAISLCELGAQTTRLDLVCRLIEHLSQWFAACDRGAIRDYFHMHNAMVGTLRTFKFNNTCYHGIVEHIDPLGCITIETPTGRFELPVAQTQHIRGDEPCEDLGDC